MERSNLATPFTRAFVVDPRRIAPVGLALSLTVTVPATFASCPLELGNETVTGNVAPGRAYGKTSTAGDKPAVAGPTLATSRPVSSASSSDGACAPQAFTSNDAATSAPRYFSRFTSCVPTGRKRTACGRLSGEHPVEVGHFHVVGAAPARAGGRTAAPAGARTRASCDRAAARSLRARPSRCADDDARFSGSSSSLRRMKQCRPRRSRLPPDTDGTRRAAALDFLS